MSGIKDILQANKVRADLADFWQTALAIESTSSGLTLALPQTGADGWQLAVDIAQPTPSSLRITDAGRTLGALSSAGQNIETDAVATHIKRILRDSQVEREGLELFRWLRVPLEPVEVHVFAEALIAISHLYVLHEPAARLQDLADITLRKVFQDHKVHARPNAILTGKTEREVRVDYVVQQKRVVAFEILHRRNKPLPVMEQWGYRWTDIRKVTPTLMPVMLYDRAQQEIDDASRAIGEEVCELFCPYDETDRIHEVLKKSSS